MKNLKLIKLRSGNYRIARPEEKADVSFKTQKAFVEWYKNNGKHMSHLRGQKHFGYIIRAVYSQSQTYFYHPQEVIEFCKKNNII